MQLCNLFFSRGRLSCLCKMLKRMDSASFESTVFQGVHACCLCFLLNSENYCCLSNSLIGFLGERKKISYSSGVSLLRLVFQACFILNCLESMSASLMSLHKNNRLVINFSTEPFILALRIRSLSVVDG